MELGIVRAHNCTVVTYKLFTRITEISQWLVVQETLLFQDRVHLVSMRMRILSPTKAIIHTRVERLRSHSSKLRWLIGVHSWSQRCWILRSGWLRIFNFLTNLNALCTLCIIISLFRLGSYIIIFVMHFYLNPSSLIYLTSYQMPCLPS